ncbi:MAG: hypothetical protein DWQ08_15870 [Proteobacteria bacterium]|nr:MAG: hypothetical protein DWQ08_15870 [Pseudomonadota bacterium]
MMSIKPVCGTCVAAGLLAALLVFAETAVAEGFGGVNEMVLNQPLRVETGWARSFVQHGKPVRKRELEKFDAYCSVEVTTVARVGDDIVVEPGAFSVTRIQHKHIPGGVFGGLLNLEDDPGPVEPEVDIYLESPRQPGVLRARCVKWESDAAFARRVTLDEVREAFGNVASFR